MAFAFPALPNHSNRYPPAFGLRGAAIPRPGVSEVGRRAVGVLAELSRPIVLAEVLQTPATVDQEQEDNALQNTGAKRFPIVVA
jgi:hypothetical protein